MDDESCSRWADGPGGRTRPLRLVVGGNAIDVRGPKRRALLAVAEGRVVTVDHLAAAGLT